MAKQALILATSKIPALYAQEGVKDPIVHVKLFSSGWTWLLIEYDPVEDLAFGFAYNCQMPDCAELGYISLAELKSLKWHGIPAVERDAHFDPKPLSEAKRAECPGT
jgi:hypothetical protein